MEQPAITQPVRAYLGLGGNLGDVLSTMRAACRALGELPGTQVVQSSTVYRTSPVGYIDQPEFLNTVIALDTSLDPCALAAATKAIERSLGRLPRPQWHAREIDIDILTFDAMRCSTADLIIPHPRLQDRRFVLAPFAEIAPDALVPGLGRVDALLAACPDRGQVVAFGTLNLSL